MKKSDARMKRGTKLLKKMGRDGLLQSQKETYPDLYEMTVGHLFGDIWTRPHLSLRDRQLITIAAGVALARPTGNQQGGADGVDHPRRPLCRVADDRPRYPAVEQGARGRCLAQKETQTRKDERAVGSLGTITS